MLRPLLAAALLASGLSACAHAVPTTPALRPAAAVRAKSAMSIAKAVKTGQEAHLQTNIRILLEGTSTVAIHYFWRPWTGETFPDVKVDGKRLNPDAARAFADQLAGATLAPGVDPALVKQAVELVRLLAAT